MQSTNSTENLREVGASSKPTLQSPNFDQHMSMSSVTTRISSQAQSPLYGQQQWTLSPQSSYNAPELSSYLRMPQTDPPHARQIYIQPTYTSLSPPSTQTNQSPPSHLSEPTNYLPAPARAVDDRPSLVSRYTSNVSHTVSNGLRPLEDGTYDFSVQPLHRSDVRSQSSNAQASSGVLTSSSVPASYVPPKPPQLVYHEHGWKLEEKDEDGKDISMYA